MKLKHIIKRGLSLIQPTKNYMPISHISRLLQRLKEKKIIITGGGKGLGKAMAKKFVAEGASVLITGRDENALKTAASEINCLYLQFNVTDFKNMDAFLKQADEMLSGADVLINNAGLSLHEKNITSVSLEQFDAQINTNLKASYFFIPKISGQLY